MRNNFIWICFLTWPLVLAGARPAESARGTLGDQVISVRITSSVAVGRSQLRPNPARRRLPSTPQFIPVTEDISDENPDSAEDFLSFDHNENETQYIDTEPTTYGTETPLVEPSTEPTTRSSTDTPSIPGANIEFIKQLNARKGVKLYHKPENDRYFNPSSNGFYPNDTEDSAAEASVQSEVADEADKDAVNEDNVPLARSIQYPVSSDNDLQVFGRRRPFDERHNDQKITTVGFNVDHEMSGRAEVDYNDYTKPAANTPTAPRFHKPNINTNLSMLPKIYNEPAKVYSQPAKFYSEPAKFYSEPAKIYSEPAKIYSEPAKVYSEPAKIYSEPAKFYSQPASLHLPPGVSNVPWQHPTPRPEHNSGSTERATVATTTPISTNHRSVMDHQPEKNYEVDETESVMSDGRSHGVQEEDKEKCRQENCKVGYVVEGRQYKKYQVEEKTADGFIVGEYGVVRNEDGALRGVRYTADSAVSPRLIYDTLMKFLQLK